MQAQKNKVNIKQDQTMLQTATEESKNKQIHKTKQKKLSYSVCISSER